MCEEFDKNRRILAAVIYSTPGEFTEQQIAKEYKRQTGSFMVDAGLSISGYLKDLRDLGSLSLYAGRYQVRR
jgi:hypothetical protein